MSQSQSGGMGSTNLQVGTFSVGLSYSDARSLFMDLFEANFAKTRDAAKEIANERAAELREELFEKLEAKGVKDLDAFNQPEKQSALIDAQKAIALSGDEELRGMLADTIVAIAGEPERSLKSIVLQEAIKILPNLTKRQMGVVATSYLVRLVAHHNSPDGRGYFDLVRVGLGNDPDVLNFTEGDFRHIEYCRCGVVELGEVPLHRLFQEEYPGLITKGLTPEDFVLRMGGNVPKGAAMKCLFDGDRVQPAANSTTVLRGKASALGWGAAQVDELEKILTENLLDDSEFAVWLTAQGQFAGELAHKWATTSLKSLKLTSVGIAIGHTFATANGLRLNDLSIWL